MTTVLSSFVFFQKSEGVRLKNPHADDEQSNADRIMNLEGTPESRRV